MIRFYPRIERTHGGTNMLILHLAHSYLSTAQNTHVFPPHRTEQQIDNYELLPNWTSSCCSRPLPLPYDDEIWANTRSTRVEDNNKNSSLPLAFPKQAWIFHNILLAIRWRFGWLSLLVEGEEGLIAREYEKATEHLPQLSVLVALTLSGTSRSCVCVAWDFARRCRLRRGWG